MSVFRISVILLLQFFYLSIQGQVPVGSHIDHEDMLAKGFVYQNKKICIYDPEAKFIQPAAERMVITNADYYVKDAHTVIAISGKVATSIAVSSTTTDLTGSRVNCVDNPAMDKVWASGQNFSEAVNAAIAAERTEFTNPAIADYVHPSYTNNYEQSEQIIEALRTAYQAGYADLEETSIENDLTLNDISQDFSCRMDQCNEFNHQSDCLGTLVERVEAGIGGNSCWSSISENIGAAYGYASDETAILAILYFMMYSDVGCCNNTHREAILKCSFTTNTEHGFGFHYTLDNDPYELVMSWDFVTLTYNGGCTDDISIGTPTCEALPLEWISISGTSTDCGSAEISWEIELPGSASEFEVYRADLRDKFHTIAQITTNMENDATHFTFTDHSMTENSHFYKIKATDPNGYEQYSDIIQVMNPCKKEYILSPNPVGDFLYLHPASGITDLSIFDLNGKLLLHSPVRNGGVDLSGLLPGMYIVKIHRNGSTWYERIVRQ